MKNLSAILIAIFISFSTCSQSQSDALFSAQMQVILIDVPHNFEHFKGLPIQEDDSSAVFTSKMTLPGTSKNEISTNKKGTYYTATIAASLTEKAAAELGTTWKEKIINSIGKGYKETPFKANDKKLVRDGFMLVQDTYSVTIHWQKKENEETYTMYLAIIRLN